MNEASVLEVCLFGVLGLGIGTLHFLTLWWNARAYARPQASHLASLVLHVGRLATTAALFVWVAAAGAAALLAALGGFLLARPLITRLVVRPA